MTDFASTLAALATAASKASKAEATVAEKATAHAPFALAAILSGETSLEGWINKACDVANVKSKKGKRNAAALREGGFGGLYNMAQSLKWIDDNRDREDNENGNIAVDILCYQFCRIDYNGDVARDYLVSKGELPAVAKQMTREEAIESANAYPASERLAHSADYHMAIKAPATFAALMKEAKAVCKTETTFADRIEKMAEKILELEAADVAVNSKALETLFNAIAAATAKVNAEDESLANAA